MAPPDVRYASISNQSFAAPRLVATGHEQPSADRDGLLGGGLWGDMG